MRIQFCGAATEVTGSCHLVTTEKHKFLLDCGMFQGGKEAEALNAQDFPFDPAEIDYVIVSHAHIDHSGRLPLLVKRGFKGPIYCTDATADLLDIMLKDSAFIQEKEAEYQNRKNQRAGRPNVEPLYTGEDALHVLPLLKPCMYNELVYLDDDKEVKLVFNDAGHILGSAIVEVFIMENGEETKVVFSGDLGMRNRPILKDPTIIKKADHLIMETTYGNRVHDSNANSIDMLVEIIRKTVARGGNVIIPAFAVGRTQELLFEFNRFYEENEAFRREFQDLDFYVDSPMAASATEIFKRNAQDFDEETQDYIVRGNHPLDFPNLKFVRSSTESQSLNFDSKPKVILSASGMCDAGRIRHHLKHNLWSAKNSVVFVGYQAMGTLGRSIVDGEKDVTIFGEKIHVEAEIYNLEGFSGHADRDALLDWLGGFQKVPSNIFLVHGEMEGKQEFAASVKNRFGYDVEVVHALFSEYELIKNETAHQTAEGEEDWERAEKLRDIRKRISTVHDQLESILYQALLVTDAKESSESRTDEINNLILSLEKNTLNLGSLIHSEDRSEEEAKAREEEADRDVESD